MDEGPVILQDVFHINVGVDRVEDVKRKGLELESQVLSKAVQLYLDGKIDQWYSRGDGKGVVFLLRCSSVSEATALMDSLPLHKKGYMTAEYMALGPLGPLRVFVAPPVAGDTAK